jgi:hypothetical protein
MAVTPETPQHPEHEEDAEHERCAEDHSLIAEVQQLFDVSVGARRTGGGSVKEQCGEGIEVRKHDISSRNRGE